MVVRGREVLEAKPSGLKISVGDYGTRDSRNSKTEQEVQLFGPKFKEAVRPNLESEEFLAIQPHLQFKSRNWDDKPLFVRQ